MEKRKGESSDRYEEAQALQSFVSKTKTEVGEEESSKWAS